MKKFFGLLMLVFLVVSSVKTANAADYYQPMVEYEQYNQLIRNGILADDISFNYWKELKEASLTLEKELNRTTEFELVLDSQERFSSYSNYKMTIGDVFITSGTSSAGILGHAGIAISSSEILHIAGPGYHPNTISLAEWNSIYTTEGWTKIYRHVDASVANDAGKWASETYKGTTAKYVISTDLSSTHETYCSKLVWQSYYYGPSEVNANGPAWGVRLPYDLPVTIYNLTLEKTYEQTK